MIYIDRRLGSFDLPSIAPLSPSICTLCELDSADVLFTGNGPDDKPISVAIELKSISDLLSSSANGRLQGCDTGQLTRMLDTYDIPMLLYYGQYMPSDTMTLLVKRQIGNKWVWYQHKRNPNNPNSPATPYTYISSMLMSIHLAGIWTERCGSKKEAAAIIYTLYEKLQRPWASHKLFHTFNRASAERQDIIILRPELPENIVRCARVAKELSPSIGYERSVEIAKFFHGNVRQMINATVDQWRQVPGIGKVIARSVVEALK